MIKILLYILAITPMITSNILMEDKRNSCPDDKIVSSVSEFKNSYLVDEPVILRTYSLKFKALNQCEFLNPEASTIIIDSLANFLNENRKILLEVGVHLSLRYSSKYSSRFDCKHIEIISKLLEKGVLQNQLIGVNYLNKNPIIKSDKLENETLEFQENEIATNVRIEFKITTLEH